MAGWALIAHARGTLRLNQPVAAASNLHESLRMGREALHGGERASWMGMAHHRLAILNDVIGNPPAAIRELREALVHYQRIDDESSIGRVYNSMGIIHSRAGDYARALERFSVSLRYAQRLHEGGQEVIVLSNQAVTLNLFDRPHDAIAALERSLAHPAIDGWDVGRFVASNNLGAALFTVGRFDEARAAFATARTLLPSVREPMQHVEHHRSFGKFLEAEGDHAGASEAYGTALAQAESLAAADIAVDLRRGLARIAHAVGDASTASLHERAAVEAEESLQAEQRRRDLEQETLKADVALLATEHARLAEKHGQLQREHEALAWKVEALRSAAGSDPLTGLANRRGFEASVTAMIGRPATARGALILLDVDDFKRINDRHGHAIGDEVLRGVAGHLRAISGGQAARMGGDEFAVVLPDADATEANAAAHALREVLRRSVLAGVATLTGSIGVATLQEVDRDATRLMLLADERLYQAKRAGRDRVGAADNV